MPGWRVRRYLDPIMLPRIVNRVCSRAARRGFAGAVACGAALLLAVLVADAGAGDRLVLRKKPGATDRGSMKIVVANVAVELGQGRDSGDDPVRHGGSLRILSATASFDVTHALPADGWRYAGRQGRDRGYRFKGSGPIRSIRLKRGRLKVKAGGTALGSSLATPPEPVHVVLGIGQHRLCLRFDGSEFAAGRRFVARRAEPSGLCAFEYFDETMWLCRPGMAADQCLVNGLDATAVHPDGALEVVPHPRGEEPAIDCFYVYPTVHLTDPPGNHTDFSDISLELDPLLSQAARFNPACRIFAPLYRQITLATFGDTDAERYLDVAYADVRTAFLTYMDSYNRGRPFVIMGHSQGTFMVSRLLQEEIDPSPALRQQLVVALLVGGAVTVPEGRTVGGTFANIPLCTTAAETGCAIAYRTYAEGFPPENGSNVQGPEGMDTACTNPAALGGGRAVLRQSYFPTVVNQPLFRLQQPDPRIETPFVLYEGLYTAECVKDDRNRSYLEIGLAHQPGDVRENPIPFGHVVLAPSFLGTHILDYNFTLGDLLTLVDAKAEAMRRR